LPISNEWRFFFVGKRLIGYGFYWARLAKAATPVLDADGIALARECAARASERVTFFVVDIARTAEGRWLLIELNDGQTSGLGTIDADEFYRELRDACDPLASPNSTSPVS
jgi:hypothetical protein